MNKFDIFKVGFMKKRIREAYLKSSSESIRTQYSHTHTTHDSVAVSKTGYEIFGIKNNDKNDPVCKPWFEYFHHILMTFKIVVIRFDLVNNHFWYFSLPLKRLYKKYYRGGYFIFTRISGQDEDSPIFA